jgi:hypothetical protein
LKTKHLRPGHRIALETAGNRLGVPGCIRVRSGLVGHPSALPSG